MTKILSAEQIRKLDAYTIANEPIASIDLMERACRAFVQWFTGKIDATKKIGIVCGTGNNGGDGLGIARLLKEWGYPVQAWIVRGSVPESEDFKSNLQKLNGKLNILDIASEQDRGLFKNVDVLIDAVFGSGLSRPASGIYEQVIGWINASEALTISVDIPSGLMADKPSTGAIVKADFTVTFQLPKLSFLLPQSYEFSGEWVVVDIGLSKEFIKNNEASYFYFLKKDACKLIRPREKFDHKGTFGHALLVAGSYGKMGAAVLSAKAALRTGAGLLTVHSPQCGNLVLQTSVPEAMFSADADEKVFSIPPDLEKYSTVGIGPGLGQDDKTAAGLKKLLTEFKKPVVIDADGLNLLSRHTELLKLLPEGSILTPHPKEFERLVGQWTDDFDRLDKQRKFATDHKCVVIVKGAHSTTATPEGKLFFNSTGNPGMATGGTGDVLTGVVTSLVAVYLHGLAGDLAVIDKSGGSLIASDLIEYLPSAYRKISR
jgi:ADP-dependent NAD(P)H-hydrate dehydratase / NAD(P)H-hydrate epimerase